MKTAAIRKAMGVVLAGVIVLGGAALVFPAPAQDQPAQQTKRWRAKYLEGSSATGKKTKLTLTLDDDRILCTAGKREALSISSQEKEERLKELLQKHNILEPKTLEQEPPEAIPLEEAEEREWLKKGLGY